MVTSGLQAASLMHDFLFYGAMPMCVLASVLLLICGVIELFVLLRKRIHPHKLLILDMNKLLVCRVYKPELDSKYFPYVEEATTLGRHYTWKRPHLASFLEYAFEHFDVAVWSSAWKQNVDRLCEFVFTKEQRERLVFEWDQSQCEEVIPHPDPTETKPLYEKPLSRVWKEYPQYNSTNTLIFDDSPLKMRHNPPECVYAPSSWTVMFPHDDALSCDGEIFEKLKLF